MRNKFINSLVNAAEKKSNICLMVGDLGYGAVEPFCNRFPNRFINAGIAEQNMAGMAAGMAMAGHHVFTYSIGNFPTFRCAEQLRNDIDYHNLPVTTVAVGGGLSYGSLGYSHHAIQDFGLIRLLPNMLILAPCDPVEVVGCVDYITKNPQPSYLRLGKTGEKNITEPNALYPGCVNSILKNGSNKLLVTTGAVIQNLSEKILKKYDVVSFPIWGEKVDICELEKTIKKYSEFMVLEDHLKSSGFYSWILENLKDKKIRALASSMSISGKIMGAVGTHDYLQRIYLETD